MAQDEMMANRQQYWSEIDLPEKIERTRQEVKRLQRESAELREEVRILLAHQHNAQGEPVSPIKRPYGEPMGIISGKDGSEVYF